MPLSSEALSQGAQLLAAGRAQSPTHIGHLPAECAPQNLDEAMQLQQALNCILSERGFGNIVGTKIGCTTKVMQEFLGMTHPCSGAIFESTVQHGAGELDFDSFLHVGIECEIAVTLSHTIRADAAPHTIETVSPAVGTVHAAVEIVDDRYVDFASRVPDWRTWVADDFFGAGVVLGPGVSDWRSLDLAAVRGVMQINGEEVGAGEGRDIINGHPLEALVWLANQQAQRGLDLPAGWIVMLGSVVQTKWANKGDLFEVQLEGLGSASVQF
ncbi:MAG: fumarylacetoacetate hydrolase family protein [Planctomycetaceae bacterium]|nr:fumarylacetoacetate hydrolase family protein [Planctomycetaceae bacterium]